MARTSLGLWALVAVILCVCAHADDLTGGGARHLNQAKGGQPVKKGTPSTKRTPTKTPAKPTPAKTPSKPTPSKTPAKTSTTQPKCRCPKGVRDLQCASNGKTYISPCHLKCDPTAKLAYPGACKAASKCTAPSSWFPICGHFGTYLNAAEMRCAGDKYKSYGRCPEDAAKLVCTKEYAPVCAVNNKTYRNRCAAWAAGVIVAYSGACNNKKPSLCKCKSVFRPVCAAKFTYPNACIAKCLGHKSWRKSACKEEAPKKCNCPLQYVPVCGKDKVTYQNRCRLDCWKVKLDYDGECKPAF